MAIYYSPKLVPINCSEIIMTTFFVPFQIWIRECKPEYFDLFGHHIHKTLA